MKIRTKADRLKALISAKREKLSNSSKMCFAQDRYILLTATYYFFVMGNTLETPKHQVVDSYVKASFGEKFKASEFDTAWQQVLKA